MLRWASSVGGRARFLMASMSSDKLRSTETPQRTALQVGKRAAVTRSKTWSLSGESAGRPRLACATGAAAPGLQLGIENPTTIASCNLVHDPDPVEIVLVSGRL